MKAQKATIIPGVQHSMVITSERKVFLWSPARWEQENRTEEKVGQVWKEPYPNLQMRKREVTKKTVFEYSKWEYPWKSLEEGNRRALQWNEIEKSQTWKEKAFAQIHAAQLTKLCNLEQVVASCM